MHLFKLEEADADLICFIENELPTSGIIPTTRELGASLFAILASMHPAPRKPASYMASILSQFVELLTRPGGAPHAEQPYKRLLY